MKSVLLVDDEPAFRNLCKRILEDEGYRVVVAADASEAIGCVETEHPDVVVLDIRMPCKSGLDLAEEFHATHPSMPVILCTGCDELCERDARSQLAIACVGKGSNFTELVLAVGRALAPHRPPNRFRFGLAQKPE